MNTQDLISFPSYLRSSLLDVAKLKEIIFIYGFVIKVNIQKGTMTVRISKSGKSVYRNIMIPVPSKNFMSMPKIGDVVLLGFNPAGDVFCLNFLLFKHEFETDNPTDTDSEKFGNFPSLNEGEFFIQATKQVEDKDKKIISFQKGSIYGDDKGNIEIKDGNLSIIKLDVLNRELQEIFETIREENYKIRKVQGTVKRETTNVDGSTEMVPLVTNGIPQVSTSIPALTESRLKIGQEVNNITGEDIGEPEIEITFADEVIDDNMIPQVDNSIKKLRTLIKYKNGLTISINSSGQINIGDGSMIIIPKKRTARENDLVETPVGLSYIDSNHPKQATNAMNNVAEMQTLATMFMSPMGPCQFIPSGNINFKANITEGSDVLFVGD